MNSIIIGYLKILVLTTIIISCFTIVFLFFDHSHFNGLNNENDKLFADKLFNRIYYTITVLSSSSTGKTPEANTRELQIISMLLQLILISSVIGGLYYQIID